MGKNIKNREVYSEPFLYMSIIFVCCLLISNILASKILSIGSSFSITAGALVFPISYIINDIFAEVYGYDKTKKVIIFGFIMNLFMSLIFTLAIFLPAPVWYQNSEAFKTILGSTPRVFVASLFAYLLGSLINAKTMVVMKSNKNNKFGVRAVLSTVFGELTDSIIFVFIAFIGSLTFKNILIMIVTQVVLKTLYEILCLPVTIRVIDVVKKYEN
jgi:hypothetical protein